MMRWGGGPPITVEDDERLDAGHRSSGAAAHGGACCGRTAAGSSWRAIVMVGATGRAARRPALVRYGIDHGLRSSDGGALNLAAAAFVGVALAAVVLGRLQIWLVARVGESFLRDLRVRVFDHLMSLSLDFFSGEQTGRLVARMTSDIDALRSSCSSASSCSSRTRCC